MPVPTEITATMEAAVPTEIITTSSSSDDLMKEGADNLPSVETGTETTVDTSASPMTADKENAASRSPPTKKKRDSMTHGGGSSHQIGSSNHVINNNNEPPPFRSYGKVPNKKIISPSSNHRSNSLKSGSYHGPLGRQQAPPPPPRSKTPTSSLGLMASPQRPKTPPSLGLMASPSNNRSKTPPSVGLMSPQTNNRSKTPTGGPLRPTTKKALTVPKGPNLSTAASRQKAAARKHASENQFAPEKSTKPLTVPQGPKLASSKRAQRKGSSASMNYIDRENNPNQAMPRRTSETASTRSNNTARTYGKGFVPTRPQSPKFASAKRAAVRAAAQSMGGNNPPNPNGAASVRSSGVSRAGSASRLSRAATATDHDHTDRSIRSGVSSASTKRSLTVPVGPKFLLDAKYGDKVENQRRRARSGSSSNLYGPRNNSPRRPGQIEHADDRSTNSAVSGLSTLSKRSVTVPVAPKFALDEKYGERHLSTSATNASPSERSRKVAQHQQRQVYQHQPPQHQQHYEDALPDESF